MEMMKNLLFQKTNKQQQKDARLRAQKRCEVSPAFKEVANCKSLVSKIDKVGKDN